MKTQYRRILLKLSGEVMMGEMDYGVDVSYMKQFAQKLVDIQKESGVQIAVEVGGGNIYRWRSAQEGIQRNTADMMGMLGSVMTALNFRDVISEIGDVEAFSPIYMPFVIPYFTPRDAEKALEDGKIVVFGGGTSQQFFTTDSGAALHASQLSVDAVFKGTNVDGVYDKDPNKHDDAQKFDNLTYDEVLEKKLRVMDMTAFALLQEASIPLTVFDVRDLENISRAIAGESVGTRIIA